MDRIQPCRVAGRTHDRVGLDRDKRPWFLALAFVGVLFVAPLPARAEGSLPFSLSAAAKFGAFYGVAN
jgi:hypothetical protein